MVIGIDHIDAKIDSRTLHLKCYNALLPKWNEWTGGVVPLDLKDTSLHHHGRISTISPPSHTTDEVLPLREDTPLYSLCFSGKGKTPRFVSNELALQLEVAEKVYIRGLMAHSQVESPDDEDFSVVVRPRAKRRPQVSSDRKVCTSSISFTSLTVVIF